MTAVAWDERRRKEYEAAVLKPARESGHIPADLFHRYGMDERVKGALRRDQDAFDEHVLAVLKYWRAKSHTGVYRKITRDLCAAHDQLSRAGHLTFAHFERVTREAAERGSRELAEIVQNITTTHIDTEAVRSLAAAAGMPAADVERELGAKGVRVVDLPELPDRPPTSKFGSLREALRTRGADFSPHVVFDSAVGGGFHVLQGFRLADGTRLDDTALRAAAKRVETEPHTDRKTAAERVISILQAERDQHVRDTVVLWEIVADLHRMPPNIAERGLAQRWVRRGLDADEAGRIAAAVRKSAVPDPALQVEQEVRELLASGRLRAAERSAALLPDGHDLHARIRTVADQVTELSTAW